MKTMTKHVLSGVILAMLCGSVSALTITPNMDPDILVLTGGNPSQNAINAELADYFSGLDGCCDVELVYEQEAPKEVGEVIADLGAFAESYLTTFVDDPAAEIEESEPDAWEATIAWVQSPHIIPDCTFLLVKDGNHEPAWYFFDLVAAGWDGMETLTLNNFWPGSGAISHVSMYDCTRSVPDGGLTIALLGLGICALGIVSRLTRG